MHKVVLAINAGSSSIKFALYKLDGNVAQSLICKGLLDQHSSSTHFTIKDASGTVLDDGQAGSGKDGDLIASLLNRIEPFLGGADLTVAGHRVVHGGPHFYDPVIVTRDVLRALEDVTALAPLHQPACLAPIKTLMEIRPKLVQVACFDTAFHRTLPLVHRQFPIPDFGDDLHRYGFHGLSFEYISQCLDQPKLKTVIAHLGSGSSLCALTQGNSINTTMSLTPLDGLVMATRCGTIDPGLLLYLQRSKHLSADDIEEILYHKSGLLALSRSTSDMRALLTSDEDNARLAVEQFCARAAQQIAVMATSLGGFDRLVFTGGIGEHSCKIRAQISKQLHWLGLQLDQAGNIRNHGRISSAESTIIVEVIPTNEELMICTHTARLLPSSV